MVHKSYTFFSPFFFSSCCFFKRSKYDQSVYFTDTENSQCILLWQRCLFYENSNLSKQASPSLSWQPCVTHTHRVVWFCSIITQHLLNCSNRCFNRLEMCFPYMLFDYVCEVYNSQRAVSESFTRKRQIIMLVTHSIFIIVCLLLINIFLLGKYSCSHVCLNKCHNY